MRKMIMDVFASSGGGGGQREPGGAARQRTALTRDAGRRPDARAPITRNRNVRRGRVGVTRNA